MQAKPSGLGPEYGAQFDDASVVAAYDARPPYPESLVSLIREVAGAQHPRLLDLGCGTGELTRRLAPHASAIVAVDRSPRMIDAARAAPGGDAPNITWTIGEAEHAPVDGPFDLAVAAESFHWFDWIAACRAIARVVPTRRLVLVEGRHEVRTPWAPALAALTAVHSTNREFVSYDLVGELLARGLFAIEGRRALGPEPFAPSVDEYVQSIHSRNGFSRDRMSAGSAHAFDAAVRALVAPHAQPRLELEIETRVAWGRVSN
ncbi:MAG TPA: class I SAM-dependent methyltransferase [Vicinamibacterales bacterium]|nr:class I SAM-dependent methyltransferase [Vicinamibacterales bacterium]